MLPEFCGPRQDVEGVEVSEEPYPKQVRLRPAVRRFAREMEMRLREHESKGGWKICSDEFLIHRLFDELMELVIAKYQKRTLSVRKEAADVGNFAMMVFDNNGGDGE